MVSYAVLNLFDEALVELRKRSLKTSYKHIEINEKLMSKLAEKCHDADILKDAKLLDAISSALEVTESSSRSTTYVVQTKANLQIQGEAWRLDSVSEGGNGRGDRVIEVDTVEVICEWCGHVVPDPNDDNKRTECRNQYKERNCNECFNALCANIGTKTDNAFCNIVASKIFDSQE